ncbi:MAG TPA: DinB family protein [Gemmatimonadaceae bacterium]|nr:DinB family protein [Gemmatimonadaceae bacterium]
MAEATTRRKRAPETAEAYIARLLAALGGRDPFEVLETTPSELRRAVAGLTPEQLATPEGFGEWSVREVLQHLVDSEVVGAFRIRMVLAHDRPTLAGYDQERWAASLHYDQTNVPEALEEFEVLRAANVRLLRRLSAQDRLRVGLHSERGEESIEQMILNYAGHDLVHLRQIARIREAIGAPNEGS